ncbi:hypothetical protein TRFO_33411 [Tritrichomonas foetus]|uniref:Cell division cycle protein 123 homolog n=1 Tax=Tritrichomonas foetus TaxID=1144522 RepID=A0A1J4JLR2_9EUKA|nr:hypothetical protein TRFO_33411 [Tritrichomonas foetus]|eukprot:OHT00027.1 hypothetical protein TRFO_33411 [Tritrichomonas foetus]
MQEGDQADFQSWINIFPSICNDDYVENWYPLVKDITFPTDFIRLSFQEVKILYTKVRMNLITRGYLSKTHQNSFLDENEEDEMIFQNLKNRIQKKLNEIGYSEFFARLGSRSYKDASSRSVLSRQRFINLLQNEYKNYILKNLDDEIDFQTEGESVIDDISTIQDFAIISHCEIQSLKCQNVEDLFDLLINSNRICKDLSEDLPKMNQDSELTLCVRKWDNLNDDRLEFRVFIYHDHITAISQYDYRCFYDIVYSYHNEIKKAIVDFVSQEIIPKIKSSNLFRDKGAYVVDVGCIVNEEKETVEKVQVIEFNRFHDTTGAALFEWRYDIDLLIGKTSNEDIAFRIVCPSDITEKMSNIHIPEEMLELKNEALRNLFE